MNSIANIIPHNWEIDEYKRDRWMKNINKPRNGFRYGVYSKEIICEYAALPFDSGMYEIVIIKAD